jgi:predicted enzyme related to lactoylglutathione lyase
MDVDVLLAAMPVANFEMARTWYERLFGRPADVVAHDEEVMWRVAQGGWLYVLCDPAGAGHATVTMAVPDIDAGIAALEGRGVAVGPVERVGDAGRRAVARDPDGNCVAIIQVARSG